MHDFVFLISICRVKDQLNHYTSTYVC